MVYDSKGRMAQCSGLPMLLGPQRSSHTSPQPAFEHCYKLHTKYCCRYIRIGITRRTNIRAGLRATTKTSNFRSSRCVDVGIYLSLPLLLTLSL
jgi:hypothetical protein